MPLEISFELSDSDLERFKELALSAHNDVNKKALSQDEIVESARQVFEGAANQKDLPEFIASQLAQLEILVDMVSDTEWQLPEEELERVLIAMAYFANPDDIIPDDIPTIGFLDDAIMVSLAIDNLEPEITSYQEFSEYRNAEVRRRGEAGQEVDITKEDWLAKKRHSMHRIMRVRRQNRRSSGGWRAGLW
jgi:uncharacterized membrane protein YkvA (DUF1232 family)